MLERDKALLLIVDVQERYRKVLTEVDNLTRNISILVEAAKILDVPVIVTEQYPQGLGRTVPEITECLGDHALFTKKTFSCCGADGFVEALKQSGRKQVIVCGIETHVCVSQTVHDLLQEGYAVHIVVDALSSRNFINKEIGIEKMTLSGAIPSTVEMALFELLKQAGTEEFKAVQSLVI